jgi:hypothetical protein
MRLKIELPATWTQVDGPDRPASFCRDNGSGTIQVSWAEYRGGELPTDITAESLKDMAETFGHSNGFGELAESSVGNCPYGMFGTGVFHSAEYPRIQVWFISNGRDHIMATHICSAPPEESEIADAQQIAASLALGPERPLKPRWKFW